MVGHSGISDWLIQRISAVLMLAYVAFMLGFYLGHPTLNYEIWHSLFSSLPMRICNVLVLLALLWHAWIGIWTVLTDYVKPVALRGVIEILIVLALLACFVWGIQIFWS
jgi:succinate dehydrogenase / fumarate reductase membrane anchor subunit